MRFGVNFFPSFLPEQKSGAQYFAECLNLVERADQLGFASVRIVEHHFKPYGGASPNPIVFLSAASQRAPHVRLVTGAVVPAFNHPLKYAGELAMLDCISGGRLDAGFARAFLPDEFEAFGVATEDSRARYEEGIAACVRLWTEENVTFQGRFHRWENVTVYPRPEQKPHPPVWVAAIGTPQSFEWAGKMGYNLMLSRPERCSSNVNTIRNVFSCNPAFSRHLAIDIDQVGVSAKPRSTRGPPLPFATLPGPTEPHYDVAPAT